MKLRRRDLVFAGPALLTARTQDQDPPRTVPDYEKPLFELHKVCRTPVRIASIELLRNGNVYLVRARSQDGVEGLARTKQIEDFIPILLRRVIPHFLGKDARDLEQLVDEVYVANYKMAGQAFWCPVAYVEQSLWDLLGKVTGKSVGELMGGVLRREIPVYLSGSERNTTAEEEVEIYVKAVALTGARAVKFKIGGRMSRNADVYPGRTRRLMTLARKRLGDDIVIYADANGSYDSKVAIEVGRMLEDLKVGFFEEPCPWEELGETKRVADALSIPVAGGEQDASLWRFQWMIENRVLDIVQPDLNYNGGFVRAARVARMARLAKMWIVPHNTQTDAAACNILQFASAIPNTGPYMEFPFRGPRKPASWYSPNFEIRNGVIRVPEGPGLGIRFDPDWLEKAVRVETC
ncbi:MAG: mandelate racemase/muconate lactonizing enzyme family protein [Bryobacterales bacterium]|nr:mandelate racemase/muconate lactonizing enzyme family protein [Bryobacteraceae bacterium]MDW8131465.1 mandelate racemase/muconate lactonizing enzyme family protein [Bryobacterales bacterium]